MADTVDTATRIRIMARCPRYLLHLPELPGKPDLIFPRYKGAIFVNGGLWYWHGALAAECQKQTLTIGKQRSLGTKPVTMSM